MMPENGELQDHDNDGYDEHEQGNTVDAVHVFHPLRVRLIRIAFFNIQVFSYLSPDSHLAKV